MLIQSLRQAAKRRLLTQRSRLFDLDLDRSPHRIAHLEFTPRFPLVINENPKAGRKRGIRLVPRVKTKAVTKERPKLVSRQKAKPVTRLKNNAITKKKTKPVTLETSEPFIKEKDNPVTREKSKPVARKKTKRRLETNEIAKIHASLRRRQPVLLKLDSRINGDEAESKAVGSEWDIARVFWSIFGVVFISCVLSCALLLFINDDSGHSIFQFLCSGRTSEPDFRLSDYLDSNAPLVKFAATWAGVSLALYGILSFFTTIAIYAEAEWLSSPRELIEIGLTASATFYISGDIIGGRIGDRLKEAGRNAALLAFIFFALSIYYVGFVVAWRFSVAIFRWSVKRLA